LRRELLIQTTIRGKILFFKIKTGLESLLIRKFIPVFFLLSFPIVILSSTQYHPSIIKKSYNQFLITTSHSPKEITSGYLFIDDLRGNIKIIKSTLDQINVNQTITIFGKTEPEMINLIKRSSVTITEINDNGKYQLHLTESKSVASNISTQYIIEIPDNFYISIQSEFGSITVTELSGQFKLNTENGDIFLENISGGIDLSTKVGNITVNNSFGKVTSHTDFGTITLSNIVGSIDSQTEKGNIMLNSVAGHSISAASDSGDIEIDSLRGALYVSTEWGDIRTLNIKGSIDLFTSNGDIFMKNISGDTIAWTDAGNINGLNLNGAIESWTYAGDIDLRKNWDRKRTDHHIKLNSATGDIHLTVPENFPANFDIYTYTPEFHPSHAILSYFPLYITADESSSTGVGFINHEDNNVLIEANYGHTALLINKLY
jgi:DUF4097 and DUF4098 domain-containing protein YvlB